MAVVAVALVAAVLTLDAAPHGSGAAVPVEVLDVAAVRPDVAVPAVVGAVVAGAGLAGRVVAGHLLTGQTGDPVGSQPVVGL